MSDVYESGMRGAEKPHKGEVTEVLIKPASNGFTVEVCRHPGTDGKGRPLYFGDRERPSVHESLDSALDRVREHLKGKEHRK